MVVLACCRPPRRLLIAVRLQARGDHQRDLASRKAKGRNCGASLTARLELGSRIAAWFAKHPSPEQNPWKRIVEEELKLKYSDAVRMRLKRAYKAFVEHKGVGAFTDLGAGATSRKRRRRASTAIHTTPSDSIGHELLQWFIDEIVSQRCRADATMRMNYAKGLRHQLEERGFAEKDLPVINKVWLHRWRKRFGVSSRRGTTVSKVSLTKACARIATMLGNIFRSRAPPFRQQCVYVRIAYGSACVRKHGHRMRSRHSAHGAQPGFPTDVVITKGRWGLAIASHVHPVFSCEDLCVRERSGCTRRSFLRGSLALCWVCGSVRDSRCGACAQGGRGDI